MISFPTRSLQLNDQIHGYIDTLVHAYLVVDTEIFYQFANEIRFVPKSVSQSSIASGSTEFSGAFRLPKMFGGSVVDLNSLDSHLYIHSGAH